MTLASGRTAAVAHYCTYLRYSGWRPRAARLARRRRSVPTLRPVEDGNLVSTSRGSRQDVCVDGQHIVGPEIVAAYFRCFMGDPKRAIPAHRRDEPATYDTGSRSRSDPASQGRAVRASPPAHIAIPGAASHEATRDGQRDGREESLQNWLDRHLPLQCPLEQRTEVNGQVRRLARLLSLE